MDEDDDVVMAMRGRAEVRWIVQLKKEDRVSVWSSSNIYCASNRLGNSPIFWVRQIA